MIIRKCKGCGAVLQKVNEDAAGFVPVLDEKSCYCKRCFRMKHYNELPKIVATNEDYLKVINNAVKQKALMIFIIDIFAFKSTFTKQMIEKLRGKDVILVANKYDLFPKSTNVSNIVDWLSKACEKIFFKVLAIHVVSSKKGYFISDLLHTIDLARRERDVYFVGCANVGKSSLINSLLKENTSTNNDVIATSLIPGTTLNEIRIPFFDDNRAFIDTPGLINETDVLNSLLPISYEQIVPNKEIKPLTYQIIAGNALFLAGLASLEFNDCEKLSVIVYASNNLYIHRTKAANIDNLYATQLGKLLTPPTLDEVPNLSYQSLSFNLEGNKKTTIWFSGFGFVSIIGKCKIHVKTLEKTEVYLTNAII